MYNNYWIVTLFTVLTEFYEANLTALLNLTRTLFIDYYLTWSSNTIILLRTRTILAITKSVNFAFHVIRY